MSEEMEVRGERKYETEREEEKDRREGSAGKGDKLMIEGRGTEKGKGDGAKKEREEGGERKKDQSENGRLAKRDQPF